jgi:CRISPR-associated protein Csb3
MNNPEPNIRIPVDLTNPGQFFACCGLLELADRLWLGAEGWFEAKHFCICSGGATFVTLIDSIRRLRIENTMTTTQLSRLDFLSSLAKKQRQETRGLEDEKKELESLRREEPIVLLGDVSLRIDWFRDENSGGSRFKTWAGQQSVLEIASAMKDGAQAAQIETEAGLWNSVRGIGLPFNFDSDLGGQGSALDIGFSFDPLAASEVTRIEGACKPALELLSFVGLQRFRPRELPRENRFIYTAWDRPMLPSVAALVACQAIQPCAAPSYEFRLLYRTKYLKSFLPAQPYQGDDRE